MEEYRYYSVFTVCVRWWHSNLDAVLLAKRELNWRDTRVGTKDNAALYHISISRSSELEISMKQNNSPLFGRRDPLFQRAAMKKRLTCFEK